MAKDYAKKKMPARNSERKTRWLAVFAGLCLIGAAITYAIHLHQESRFLPGIHISTWVEKAIGNVKNKPITEAQKTVADEPIHFDFYTELPKMRVAIPAVAPIASEKALSAAPKTTAQFVVQISEFKSQIQASQLRLSLLLAGIDTQIIKTTQQTYRVQQGPFGTERQAKTAQQRLNQKGFDSTLSKL